MEHQQYRDAGTRFRARDCIRDGWRLYGQSIVAILLFSVAAYVMASLRPILIAGADAALGGRYETFDFNTENALGLLSLMNGGTKHIPPAFPWNIAVLAVDLLAQLAVGFVVICGTVWITVKTLSVMNSSQASRGFRWQSVRANAAQMFKLWFAFYMIVQTPFYLVKFAGLFLDSSDGIVALLGLLLNLFGTVCAFVMALPMNYSLCRIIEGDIENPVKKSIGLIRCTAGKQIGILSAFIRWTLLVFILFFIVRGLSYATWYMVLTSTLSVILAQSMTFWLASAMAALYYRVAQPAPPEDEEEYTPADEQVQVESKDVEERFAFRVRPSLLFDEVSDFYEGLARVRQPGKHRTGKWGYVDTHGNMMIPFRYKEASDFNDNLAVVGADHLEWYVDKDDRIVISSEYSQADRFSEGLALVRIRESWCFITPDGTPRRLPYDEVYSFREGLAAVYDGQKWLYIDKNMNPVIRTEYDDVWSFYEGRALVEKDGKFGYIDKTGHEVVPLRYDDARSFQEGLAAVATEVGGERRWGYIDHAGRDVIQPRFEETASFEDADSFSEGRASVCVNGKYGHINTGGQWITPAEYEAVGAFSQGFAVVKDTGFGYVDRNGVECTAPLYQDARPFREGLAWVRTDEGWGILEIPEHGLSGDAKL